jgi:hypothetical protein
MIQSAATATCADCCGDTSVMAISAEPHLIRITTFIFFDKDSNLKTVNSIVDHIINCTTVLFTYPYWRIAVAGSP